MVLNWRQFYPPGDTWECLGTGFVVRTGVSERYSTPCNAQDDPTTKNDGASSVDSADRVRNLGLT